MKNVEEIIAELRSITEWSRPNVAYEKTMDLLNELEEVINPSKPEPLINNQVKFTPQTPEVVELSESLVVEIPNDVNITIDDIKAEVSEPVKKVIAKRPKVTK